MRDLPAASRTHVDACTTAPLIVERPVGGSCISEKSGLSADESTLHHAQITMGTGGTFGDEHRREV